MDEYNIKNIQIQGDGIFGITEWTKENCTNAKNVFDAAMHINGFLSTFWKIETNLNYKISIALQEELILLINRNNYKELVYFGGSINKAKKNMENYDIKNKILIDKSFVEKNKNILINKDNKPYYNQCNNFNNFKKDEIYTCNYCYNVWKE